MKLAAYIALLAYPALWLASLLVDLWHAWVDIPSNDPEDKQ